MNVAFHILPIASPLHDPQALGSLLGAYAERLEQLGGRIPLPESAEPSVPRVLFVLTGGTEQRVLDAIAGQDASAEHGPVLLLAHRGHNSLPAALEVLARLQQDGRRGRILFLQNASDDAGFARVAAAVADLQAWMRLRTLRIGLVGAPSDWLVASMPSAQAVREVWGPSVVPVALDDLYARIDAVAGQDTEPGAGELVANASGPSEIPAQGVRDAVRVFHTLHGVVASERLDALSVRCFDLVTSRRMTGCHALAQLNDQGIPAGCEGDLASTIGLVWVRALLGQPAWMANPAAIDEAGNTLLLAHCTVPRTMVGAYRLRTHFESGLGLAIAGQFATGEVTLLRVGGRRLDKVWISDAELISTGSAEELCRTQVTVRLLDGSVSDLLSNPLGNHLVLVQGRHGARMRAWWTGFGAR